MVNTNFSAASFIHAWEKGEKTFEIFTSGSTSEPKPILLSRAAMECSAVATGKFLNVLKNDSIFCCIPISKIGGLMQLVRSMVWGNPIEIVEPSANPLLDYSGKHSIISLTAMQLQHIVNDEKSKQALNTFRIVLIGGGAIHQELENVLLQLQPVFYHTYGMTETCSHIALRKLGSGAFFTPLPGIQVQINEQHCLEICGCVTENKWISTHDIVELNSNSFKIIGRLDAIINSGGIKIPAEKIEHSISDHFNIPLDALLLVGIPDKIYQEKAVLVINKAIYSNVLTTDFSFIENPFFRPKSIVYLDDFIYTETHKINRQEMKIYAAEEMGKIS
ncbi:MAG: AMP-binding protein [Bacteroidia bacterium]|nr:AMP-binding protein [Bacteroidia bacterium]